ncbi:SDR family NAD(P)-dependent oxidoreductase [Lentibacter sp.]|uniref:SDR family NAD(P)-dependent oxidoreductase n=1 Tax=Lentibacter sp. TaxID=2024994 RepID=UPI003F6AD9EA
MQISGSIAVVTGAAKGIGAALVSALKEKGAAHVAAFDLSDAVHSVGADSSYICDVTDAAALCAAIEAVEAKAGPIGLFCSNAGLLGPLVFDNAAGATALEWQRAWDVNVMAHVHAANVLVPLMRARGGGHFLQTASAAGLLSQIGNAAYSTTKHAAIGFAENLAISHRDEGIRVSVLCPQGVDTDMIRGAEGHPAALDGVLSAQEVAEAALAGVEAERFLILPHPKVAEYLRAKVADYDRWIGGMAKLQRAYRPATPEES